MSEKAVARGLFHRMPEQVFSMWMSPIIDKIGWPFEGLDDSTFGTEWDRLFLRRSIKQIAQLQWERREMSFARIRFTPNSKSTITALVQFHIYGVFHPQIARIPDSRERFESARQFAQLNRRTPAPCVLMHEIGAYSILDGHHRIAA